ncbi:ATP-binding protein [Limosilactobacillus mucosae]|jgi:DNA replication protein DnaC|uniref:ATP-binding protein n=1 Tax=Limosilactobacillus mucosae TaxID=97478 RepID=UPI0006973E33|nr:ATP-binding protein [Limosilactobacillus mucosae]
MAMHSIAGMAASISANLKRIAKEKGQPLPVDLDNKNAVEAYIKANNDKYIGAWNQQLKRQKFDHVYTQSLWSGQTPITFNFNNWDSSRQISKQHAEQLKQQAQQLAQRMLMPNDEPFNVMLEGSPGTGKTSLAVAMIDYIRYHGYRWGYLKHPDGFVDKYKRYADVFFLATDEMLELVYRSIDSDSKALDRLQQVVKFAKTADVLVLDDFGTEGGMKGTIRPVHKTMQELMYNINNARRKKYTIITTNNTVDELRNMYNVKLISRLIPSNPQHIIDFSGLADFRRQIL